MTPTTAPGPRRPTRVLLVGDSIAASLETALSTELTGRGVSFATIALPGCGVITGTPANGPGQPVLQVLGSDISHCAGEVPGRQEQAVAMFAPDLVISMSTWESTDRIIDGTWYRFGSPEADDALVELHRQTRDRLAATGAAVAWVLMPDTVVGRTTRPGHPAAEDLLRAEHHRYLVRRISGEIPGSTAIDLAAAVCPITPCPTRVHGVELRPGDGLHFDSPEGAAVVAREIADAVAAIDLDQIPR